MYKENDWNIQEETLKKGKCMFEFYFWDKQKTQNALWKAYVLLIKVLFKKPVKHLYLFLARYCHKPMTQQLLGYNNNSKKYILKCSSLQNFE